MSQGIIELKVKMYLECDVEKEDVKKFIDEFKSNFIFPDNPEAGVFIQEIEVEEI